MAMNNRLLRPRASGFSPKQISGLQLWLDANNSSSITLNGSNVSEWRDSSGSGIAYSQSTAAYQPAYSTGYRNGKNAIRMGQGSTTYLQSGGSPAISFKPSTWFIVFEESTRGGFARVFNAPDASNADVFGQAGITLSMHENGFPFRIAGNGFNAYPPAGDDSVAAGNNIATFIGANNKALTRRNGTAGTQSNMNNTTGTPWKSFIGVYVDGGSPFIGAYYLQGTMYEIIGYNRELSAADIGTVEKYLSKKWNITVA
jgi:hypothetical protein